MTHQSAQPRVAVVLAVYNGARFISEQIESILSQTRPPDELLVSDDCSDDGTVDIVKARTRRAETTVRVIRTPRRAGCYRNFEYAIQRSNGDIIFLSDCDDLWLPHKVATMLPELTGPGAATIVYSDAHLAGPDLRPLGRTVFGAKPWLRTAPVRGARHALHGPDLGVLGSTMAFSASAVRAFWPLGPGWGHDHWIAYLSHALGTVRAVDEPLMLYRRHPGNSGHDPALDGAKPTNLIAALRRNAHEAAEIEAARWKAMATRLWSLAGAARDPARFEDFLGEALTRWDFARRRLQTRDMPWGRRATQAASSLLSGEYHRYAAGTRSFARDLSPWP